MTDPTTPASPAPPPADAPFEMLPAVGSVELDRYCESCGYNLMRQAVRREPRTALLLVRCPECGGYTPANTLTTAHRAWFRGLAVLGWVLWVAAWVFMIGMASLILAAMLPDAAWQRSAFEETDVIQHINGMTHYNQHRVISLGAWDQEMLMISGMIFGGFVLTAIFLTTITTAFMPHWKRWGYVLFALGWPIIALMISLAIFIPERTRWRNYYDEIAPEFISWLYQYTIACVLLTAVSGALFAWLGRPLARVLVRLFVPPRQRGVFVYLWIVDGKTPPANINKPGQSAAPTRFEAI